MIIGKMGIIQQLLVTSVIWLQRGEFRLKKGLCWQMRRSAYITKPRRKLEQEWTNCLINWSSNILSARNDWWLNETLFLNICIICLLHLYLVYLKDSHIVTIKQRNLFIVNLLPLFLKVKWIWFIVTLSWWVIECGKSTCSILTYF